MKDKHIINLIYLIDGEVLDSVRRGNIPGHVSGVLYPYQIRMVTYTLNKNEKSEIKHTFIIHFLSLTC